MRKQTTWIPWSPTEKRKLKRLAKQHTKRDIFDQFPGRSRIGVCRMMVRMGLRENYKGVHDCRVTWPGMECPEAYGMTIEEWNQPPQGLCV